ncbi:ribosomal protein S18-alanine N-acetyltransferase [Bacillota bacterium LX-D]|nr:ribosomal protein S18-alanine N-acetyltransferase [Bacillota bacterium LX-D]
MALLEFEIVPMKEQHIPGVLETEQVSFPTPWSEASFLGELRDNDLAYYYVCTYQGRVVGYSGMWIIFDEAHITNIAVHSDFRGQKIGRALLTNLFTEAMRLGAERITLEVRISNTIARKLYQSMGFAPVGIRKGYYSDTKEDALIMWKDLFNL